MRLSRVVEQDMRILIVSTFYYPNMKGGAEQSIKLLAENLVKRNHEVGVFCIDAKEAVPQSEQYQGVKVFRHTAGNFNLYKFSYDKKNVGKLEKVYQKLVCYYNQKTLREFREVLSQFQPDVIHTNSTYGMSQFVWKAAYQLHISVVHTIRDTAIVSPVTYGHAVNGLVLKAHRCYVKSLTKYVTAVTAPSEYTLNTSLINHNFRNAIVKKCIPNSVQIDKERFEREMKRKKERTEELIRFMFAGRLVAYKGIEHMIEAYQKVSNGKMELHICGNGEMTDYVKQQAKKDSSIIYHGSLDNTHLDKVYELCDVMLIPSCWPEPFGRVVIEGNLHAMPVIAGNWGGIPEIIRTLKGGVTYNAPSVESLERELVRFTDRAWISSFYDDIQKNIEIYGIDRQIDAFEMVYQRVIRAWVER